MQATNASEFFTLFFGFLLSPFGIIYLVMFAIAFVAMGWMVVQTLRNPFTPDRARRHRRSMRF